ncbi:MAG: MltA domain-containing protein [Desulfuromonadales bacterium]|nr:MltA domain-containing protein [Desulfuromonadales bacterium]
MTTTYHVIFRLCLLLLICSLLLASCARPPLVEEVPPPVAEEVPPPVAEEVPAVAVEAPLLEVVGWQELPGWSEDDPTMALTAFTEGCRALRFRPQWQAVCGEATGLAAATPAEVRAYFERNFVPHRVNQADGSDSGLLTGYYVPNLRGSRAPSKKYPYPLYSRPDDLLVIDLSDIYPELGNYRLRGRVEGHRVVPYWDRAAIDGGHQPLAGAELFWVADPVELFFLHIQGSGRILLEDGKAVMVNYADQNGHPYRSIGKYLLDRGLMSRDQMSMQNIRAWVRANPVAAADLLNENPSYVFFRELEPHLTTPPGALGVPLTPERSLAVDPRYIPLGAPVFVGTTWPNSDRPLQRLMVAQDTGGAIKGRVRGDFFWGMGEQAGELAGRTKQAVRFWLLLPKTEGEGR